MALTKTETIDKYEIVGNFKIIQCRHSIIVEEDGNEISRSYHRHTIAPNDDVSGEPQEVQDLVAVVHTQAIKDAYAEYLAQQEAEMATEG